MRRHRTRLHYEIQYAFLSGCGAPVSIPLWMPCSAQGVVSSPTLFGQAGLLQSSLMLAGPAWRGVDFQPIFFLGVLAEELLFLVGCWLLARRLFRSPYAAFFVGVAALGSGFWLDRIDLNFRSLYAVPLALEFAQRAFLQRSLKYHVLTANLIWIQMLGSPPGAGFPAAFAPLIFLLARALVLREPVRDLFQAGSQPRMATAVYAGSAVAIPVVLTALLGAPVLAAPTIFPTAHDFLAYAGLGNPLQYLEVLLGVTPSLDWTLYSGALTLGFALVALRSLPRSTAWRLLLAVPAGMLALGVLMVVVYFLFLPALRPASPLPYALPFVRLFIVFLAGAGFQRALDARPAAPLRFAGGLLLAGAVLLALLCWTSIRRPDLAHDLLALTVAGESREAVASPVLEPWIYPDQLRFSLVSDLLGASCLFASLAGGLLLLWAGRPRAAPLALSLILLLHPLDAFSWKFRMSWLETFPANARQRTLQKLEPPPYSPRRLASLADAPRYRDFHRIVGNSPNPAYAPRFPDGGLSNGYWQADVDETPGAARGEKIRIYAKAHPLPEPEIARRLARPGLDRLYIAGEAEGEDAAGPSSDLLPLAPVIESFGCNGIRLRVESVPAGAWLSYADAWNSGWTASVNGAARSVTRGNLAGKALPLDAGTNLVEFRFTSPIRTLSFFLVALNSLAWLLWTLRAVFLLAWRREEP